MKWRKRRVNLNLGNLLEAVAAGLLIYGVYVLAGGGWCLIAGGIAAAVFAEFLYYDTSFVVRKGRPNDLPEPPPQPFT